MAAQQLRTDSANSPVRGGVVGLRARISRRLMGEKSSPSPMRPGYIMEALLSRALAEHAQEVSGILLDVGCGGRPYRGYYERRTEAHWGLDVDGAQKPDLVADTQALPIAAATAGTILATEVLEHVEDPALMLREVHRVLAPAGRAMVTVPFLYRVHDAGADWHRYTVFGLHALFQEFFDQVAIYQLGDFWTSWLLMWATYAHWDLIPRSRLFAPLRAANNLACAVLARCSPSAWAARQLDVRALADPEGFWPNHQAKFPTAYLVIARKADPSDANVTLDAQEQPDEE